MIINIVIENTFIPSEIDYDDFDRDELRKYCPYKIKKCEYEN